MFATLGADRTAVHLQLSLLLDASGSISHSEFDLQLDGYEAEFRKASIIDVIVNGATGRIAVNLIQWSGIGNVHSLKPDRRVTSANAFADAVAGDNRTVAAQRPDLRSISPRFC